MLSENSSFHNRNLAVFEQQGMMYSSRHSSGGCASTTQSDPRMTVADILSTMANGSQTDTITPTTFSSLECFSTGILTQTTPTLTPTTLRNIEQTFIELQSVPPTQIEHQNQAGFVPPVVNRAPIPQVTITAIPNQQPPTSKPSQSPFANINSAANNTNSTSAATATVSWNDSNSGNAVNKSRGTTKTSGVRNMGGRKPSRTEKLSPEEEERRRVRRERNKMAAARCRKRRLDHTNLLVNETNLLEDKRSELQNEIQLLQSQKDELEFLLETHKVVCKMSKRHHNHHLHQHTLDEPEDIKPNIVELNRVLKSVSPRLPPSSSPSIVSRGDHNMENNWAKKTPLLYEHKTIQRPNSLPLTSFAIPNLPSTNVGNNEKLSTITEATGISITTPSNGIFNFEALMEGGTGLTPIITGCGLTPMIPTCSNQQRSSSSDLSSPDSMTPSKLVSL